MEYQTYGPMSVSAVLGCFPGARNCPFGPLVLDTTNPAVVASLKEKLTIQPQVTLDWENVEVFPGSERRGPLVAIPGRFRPGTTYRVSIAAGVRDEFGQDSPGRQRRVPHHRPRPRVRPGRRRGAAGGQGRRRAAGAGDQPQHPPGTAVGALAGGNGALSRRRAAVAVPPGGNPRPHHPGHGRLGQQATDPASAASAPCFKARARRCSSPNSLPPS